MAAQISHILAGEGALRRAAGIRLEDELSARAALFRLGAQGPDIFYHNRRTMPSGLHYGALAHRRNYGTLIAGAAASLAADERGPESPIGAYVLGLATHAAVDRAVHPFVIYFAGWARPSDPSTRELRGCHPFLERLLDMALLRRARGLEVRDFGLSARLGLAPGAGPEPDAGSFAGAELDPELVGLWKAGLRAAYPRSTRTDPELGARIGNALRDARTFYSATDPSATSAGGRLDSWLASLGPEEARRLVSIIYPETLPPGLDPMNEAHAEWLDPSGLGEPRRSSYFELVEEGEKDAAAAMGLVLEHWAGRLGAEALAEGIGEGSLSLGGAQGEALAPRLSSPLPLARLMDEEYASHVDLH